jgi:hypothetical protein
MQKRDIESLTLKTRARAATKRERKELIVCVCVCIHIKYAYAVCRRNLIDFYPRQRVNLRFVKSLVWAKIHKEHAPSR